MVFGILKLELRGCLGFSAPHQRFRLQCQCEECLGRRDSHNVGLGSGVCAGTWWVLSSDVFAGSFFNHLGLSFSECQEAGRHSQWANQDKHMHQCIPQLDISSGCQMRFLTVQFNVAGCYWRYGSTSAPTTTSDTAQWFEPDYEKHMRIFQFPGWHRNKATPASLARVEVVSIPERVYQDQL